MSAVMNETGKEKKALRHDWTVDEIAALFDMPFNDLLFEAQSTHRQVFRRLWLLSTKRSL